MPRVFDTEKKEAESALKFAEETFGADHPMVAARLENLALLLKAEGKQLLEAANMEARAKVIRARFEKEEILSGAHKIGEKSASGTENNGEKNGDDDKNNGDKLTADNAMSQYEIIGQIGSGGMGTVYKAKHARIEKFLAVKVLSAEVVSSKPTRKRFEQEIQAACNLTHPNLVSVYDFGVTTKGAPYLVMDFIEGVTLAEEIEGLGCIEPERALNIFIQICEGITQAHSRSILHRDLKPSNIMLSEAGTGEERDFVKVVDFGLAKLMPSAGNEGKTMTSTTDVMGSPYYMSPEQCMGEKLDQRSDVYALGCVMHEALTGKPPFSEGNTIKIIFQHLNTDRKSLLKKLKKFKLQAGMENIILRCLEKKPVDRYQSVSDLLKDLQLVRAGKKPTPALSRLLKEKVVAASTIGVLVVAAGAAGIVKITEMNRPPKLPNYYGQPYVSPGPPGFPYMSQPYPGATMYSTVPGYPGAMNGSVPGGMVFISPEPGKQGQPLPQALPAQGIPVTTQAAGQGAQGNPEGKSITPTVPAKIEVPASSSAGDTNGESIIIEGNETRTLAPGRHVLSKLRVSGNGKILLKGNTKLVFQDVEGAAIDLRDNAMVNFPGPPDRLQIIHNGSGPIRVSNNAALAANVQAPSTRVYLSQNGRLFPSRFSNVYIFNKDSTWTNQSSVPENLKSLWQQQESLTGTQSNYNRTPVYVTQSDGSIMIGKLDNRKEQQKQNTSVLNYQYKNLVTDRIQRNFLSVLTAAEMTLVATLEIGIDGNGTVSGVRMVQSSRNVTFDEKTLNAIRYSSPFPAPPLGRSVSYHALFRFNKVQLF